MNENFRKLILDNDCKEILLKFKDKQFTQFICDNDLFWNNIDIIVTKFGNDVLKLIESLTITNKNYILDKFELLLPYYINNKVDGNYMFLLREIGLERVVRYLINNNFTFNNVKLFRNLLYFPGDKKILFDNIDFFISNSKCLLDMKECLRFVPNTDHIIEKINNIIDNNPNRLIEDIVSYRTGIDLRILKEEKIIDTLRIIIDELLESQNLKYRDIKKKGYGAYSNVIGIGDKILKIGKKREKFFIKNNKRFLKPIYRQEIQSINSKDTLLCIEITEMVDTLSVGLKDAYDMYKELRDQGLVWKDCDLDNIGRLIKDNQIYFEGIDHIDKNATGYLDCNDEILKKDDVVIIDNDYIYTEEEFQALFNNGKPLEENIYSLKSIRELEKRYQSEKSNKKR